MTKKGSVKSPREKQSKPIAMQPGPEGKKRTIVSFCEVYNLAPVIAEWLMTDEFRNKYEIEGDKQLSKCERVRRALWISYEVRKKKSDAPVPGGA